MLILPIMQLPVTGDRFIRVFVHTCIAQNLGSRKLWRFTTNPATFHLPKILADLLLLAMQSIRQCFFHQNVIM